MLPYISVALRWITCSSQIALAWRIDVATHLCFESVINSLASWLQCVVSFNRNTCWTQKASTWWCCVAIKQITLDWHLWCYHASLCFDSVINSLSSWLQCVVPFNGNTCWTQEASAWSCCVAINQITVLHISCHGKFTLGDKTLSVRHVCIMYDLCSPSGTFANGSDWLFICLALCTHFV